MHPSPLTKDSSCTAPKLHHKLLDYVSVDENVIQDIGAQVRPAYEQVLCPAVCSSL